MRTVNKVILIGNITRDPLVKVTAAGAKVVVFTLATNRTFTNHQGEMMSEASSKNRSYHFQSYFPLKTRRC